MVRNTALQVLKEHLGYTDETAPLVLRSVDAAIVAHKGEGHSIDDEGYPLDWLPALLLQAGEIGNTRFMELLRTDFSPRETAAERDAMLTQAFGGLTQ